ncbi:MAG: hypothetical protein IJP27_01405 [Clostridia bacterium]|nr:hypothetical protein [Clostridia bacterium]
MNVNPSILAHYEQFWEGTNTGRPLLNYSAPKEGATRFPKPVDLVQQWLDEEYLLNRHRHKMENTVFLADAVPMLFTNLGPGCLAACIGGNYDLASNTVWFDRRPVIEDWEDLPPFAFDENSEMWQHVMRLQNKYATDPDVHFSITDLGGVTDIVASLRGTQELLYDLYDYPDEFKALTKQITEMWIKAYRLQVETIKKTGQPYNNWMNLPSAKPWYPMQCDFCYMLSPAHFEEFILPELVELTKVVERPVYHLDGVGELPHLDRILEIPGLKAIQWAPGAGEAPEWDEKWFPVYRKIQDKKVNVILLRGSGVRDGKNDLEGMEKLIKSVDPSRLYLAGGFPKLQMAEEMIENITRWSE